MEKAIFAGGCFWCMVKPFDTFEGVEKVVSGYTGGHKENPTYEEVCAGMTGHVEAVEITFNPTKISYRDIVELFWQQIDPTDAGGQFYDRGDSYKTAIFYTTPEQKQIAEQSRTDLAESGRFQKEIVTPILPAKEFYPAEEYHQHFYKKNKEHYESYQVSSGRAGFIKEHWRE